MVSNQGARPRPEANFHVVTVGVGFDAADHWIVEHIETSDIVITADIQLAMRSLSQYLREAGEIKGHNPTFSKQDRSRFLQALDALIQKLRR